MNRYTLALREYLAQNPPEFTSCKMDSLLGTLYCCYQQQKRCDSEQIHKYFNKLDAIINTLSLHDQNQVISLTCSLCTTYQTEAFKEGIVTGFHLFEEL
ncbi:MAG: hypothetical protein IJN21_01125, partial [Clostridia bacterium]|nr:hypothetical protein [Clostridia bacterium]